MEEQTSSSNVSAALSSQEQHPTGAGEEKTPLKTSLNVGSAPEKGDAEQRKAYGTAKTENLRDSGVWRLVTPAFVGLLCLSLVAVPLIILIPLLYNSLQAPSGSPLSQLTWLWVTMIALEFALAALIAWGLLKIFVTQAGNYTH